MAKNDDETSGFSKITGGLTDLINLLVDLDKGGDLPHRGRREKNGVVVEYSVGRRTASGTRDETPPHEPARSKPARPAAQRTAKRTDIEVVEPVTDVFDEAEEMVFLFELPGVALSSVHCSLHGDILLLDAKSESRLYRKEALIEAALTGDPPSLRLHNGVLEVRLKKQV
jgi:HSP20 family molecular chaperone IbpA